MPGSSCHDADRLLHGATTLNGANVFTNLGAFTTDGNNAFSLTDAHDLTVTGTVNAGTAGLTLTTTGAGDDLFVNSTLTGGTVTLASAATISETGGVINATTLTGSSHGAVTLTASKYYHQPWCLHDGRQQRVQSDGRARPDGDRCGERRYRRYDADHDRRRQRHHRR